MGIVTRYREKVVVYENAFTFPYEPPPPNMNEISVKLSDIKKSFNFRYSIYR